MADAVATAPLMPSGWLCVGRAVCSASRCTSFKLSNHQATGDTRIAEPFPKLLYIPFVVLLSGIWHLESGVRHGKAAGLPIAVILAFLPLVLFGLKWKMDSTFTIIASCVWFIFMWKMAYYFFYDKTNSPIVYYSSVVVNITALMWSIIVKEYKPLEEHILKYRQDQWLVPCSENYKENKVLRSIWLVCFIGTVVFSFVCQWGVK